MDKRKPSYSLPNVKEIIKKGKTIPNLRIIQSANNIGFSETEVYNEILKLNSTDFYKSVTEYYNHKIWQDVYKKKIKGLLIYIKFQIVGDNFLLRSFKIDESS